MSRRDISSIGAPCWVDTWQPNPQEAAEFYGKLFGWSFDEPVQMSGFSGDYYVGRLDVLMVAGVGQAPPQSPAGWLTHVRVDDVNEASAQAELAGGRVLAKFEAPVRTALVTDSSGIVFCLREAGDNNAAQVADHPNSWAMSSLHTPDLEKASGFYQTMFNWELQPSPGLPFSRWVRQNQLVAVATTTDGTGVPPNWSINFSVSDTDETAGLAAKLGATILMPPSNTPGFRSALIQDPWGGILAISATTEPEQPPQQSTSRR